MNPATFWCSSVVHKAMQDQTLMKDGSEGIIITTLGCLSVHFQMVLLLLLWSLQLQSGVNPKVFWKSCSCVFWRVFLLEERSDWHTHNWEEGESKVICPSLSYFKFIVKFDAVKCQCWIRWGGERLSLLGWALCVSVRGTAIWRCEAINANGTVCTALRIWALQYWMFLHYIIQGKTTSICHSWSIRAA